MAKDKQASSGSPSDANGDVAGSANTRQKTISSFFKRAKGVPKEPVEAENSKKRVHSDVVGTDEQQNGTSQSTPAKRGRGRPRGRPRGSAQSPAGNTATQPAAETNDTADQPISVPATPRGLPKGRPKVGGRGRAAASQPVAEPKYIADEGAPVSETRRDRLRGRSKGDGGGKARASGSLATPKAEPLSPTRSSRSRRAAPLASNKDDGSDYNDDDDDEDEEFVDNSTQLNEQEYREEMEVDEAETNGIADEVATPKRKSNRKASKEASGTSSQRKPRMNKAQQRLLRKWSGPMPDDYQTNPNYIDTGLDKGAWLILREIKLDIEQLKIESSRGHISRYLPPSCTNETTDPAVDVLMCKGSGEQLDNEPWTMQPFVARELYDQTRGWMVNTGLSVWSIDWAPVRASGAEHQQAESHFDYIAVAGMTGACSTNLEEIVGNKEKTPTPSAVQIWKVDTSSGSAASSSQRCLLDMMILHDFGRCVSLKWCPISTAREAKCGLPIIGHLAAIFGDGCLRVIAVPVPDSVRNAKNLADTVYMHWPKWSLLETRSPHGAFSAVEWVSSDVLITGSSKGDISTWSVKEALRSQYSKYTSASVANEGDCIGGQWPYMSRYSDDMDGHSSPQQLIPMISHRVHKGSVFQISVACLDKGATSLSFEETRQSNDFKQISWSNCHIISTGRDGRIRETLLAYPTRQTYPLISNPAYSVSCYGYWRTGSVYFTDGDHCVRLMNDDVLRSADDQWIASSAQNPEPAKEPRENDKNRWNFGADRRTLYHLSFEGTVWSIAGSDFHSYVSVASGDGFLAIQNLMGIEGKSKPVPQYRIIYSLLWDSAANAGASKDAAEDGDVEDDAEDDDDSGSGRLVCLGKMPVQPRTCSPSNSTKINVYPLQIAIQASAWSRSPYSSCWVASAGASGILRIEDVSPDY